MTALAAIINDMPELNEYIDYLIIFSFTLFNMIYLMCLILLLLVSSNKLKIEVVEIGII